MKKRLSRRHGEFKILYSSVPPCLCESLLGNNLKEENMKRNFVIVAVIAAVVMSACIDGIPDNPFLQLPAKPERLTVEKIHAEVPQITAHPQDAVYSEGAAAVALEVVAEVDDGGELSYQWYSNIIDSDEGGTEIPGETETTYTPPTDTVGIAYYYVVVTNTIDDNGDGGNKTATAVSDTAAITVDEKVNAAVPLIESQPQSAVYTHNVGAIALTVSATTSDGGTLSYQWYRDDVFINGVTGTSYTPPTDTLSTAYYYVVVTNTIADNGDGGIKTATVRSHTATIEVNEKVNAAVPRIANQPQPADCIYGGAAGGTAAAPLTISATTSDGGTLSYRWYVNDEDSDEGGTLIPDATGVSYTPASVAGNAGTVFYYYAVVTNTIPDNGDGGNKAATERSDAAAITIVPKPVTITPLMSTSRTYDGTTNAPLGPIAQATIHGKITGDNLTVVAGTATFADANVGSGKIVTFSGWTLGGSAAGNYTLQGQPGITTANITRKELTISLSYVSPNQYLTPIQTGIGFFMSVTGLISPDTATISGVSNVPTGLTFTSGNPSSINYNGTATFTNPTVTLNVSVSAGSNYNTAATTITVFVYDGQANTASGPNDRRIPVRMNNITAFNAYARTTNGLTRHYKLMEPVTLSGINNWTAIGISPYWDPNSAGIFTGSFNGQGFTITNLNINTTGSVQGMFGTIGDDGIVQNLGLVGVSVSVSGNQYVGSVTGWNSGTVQNCYATGNVSGSYDVGGVVGGNGGTVQNCYSTGSVSGGSDNVGGVVGYNYNGGTVRGCVALNNNVKKSSASANYLGRVVGRNNNGTLTNNYARSDMTVQYNTNTNKTISAGLTTIDGATAATSTYNTQAFWTTGSNWYNNTGWNFTSVWQWNTTTNLPILRNMPTGAQNHTVP